MICYLDKTFCASPNCTNKCGRKITEDDRAKAIRMNLPIASAYFCGEPDVIAVGNKIMNKYKECLDNLA